MLSNNILSDKKRKETLYFILIDSDKSHKTKIALNNNTLQWSVIYLLLFLLLQHFDKYFFTFLNIFFKNYDVLMSLMGYAYMHSTKNRMRITTEYSSCTLFAYNCIETWSVQNVLGCDSNKKCIKGPWEQ